MKYSQVRASLLTFALGLASVSIFNSIYDKWTEIPVELPKAESGTVLHIFVNSQGLLFDRDVGSGCGGGRDEPIKAKSKKKR